METGRRHRRFTEGTHRRPERGPLYTAGVAQSFPDIAPHLAIYRRFRAQTFGQIVGQTAVVETLRNAIRLERLGHGFLFVGPRGTGKTSMARILAKAVNCTNLKDGEPCDACPNCVSIREGRALDVVELDAASNNRVDDMRELLPRVYTAPSDLRRKVFIIDEVQRIKEGWDVLLKTLEEPPEGVLFIFCTTDPSQIRPAVVSRLQRFAFRPLSIPDIEGKLRRILEAEGRTAEPDAVALVAQLAAGGMRDAESLLDQVLGNADDPITSSIIRDLVGLAEADAVDHFVTALARGDALGGISVLDELEAEGRDVVAFAEQVVIRLRGLLMERLAGHPGASEVGVAELARAARRLTGVDASRSGLGGYRWQLELALLGAASARSSVAVPVGAGGAMAAASSPSASPRPSSPAPERPPLPEPEASPAGRAPGPASGRARELEPSQSSRARASSQSPELVEAAAHSSEPPRPPGPVPARSSPPVASNQPSSSQRPASPTPAVPASPDDLTAQLREKWPAVVAHFSANPFYRTLIAACRPVEVRDGVVVLGFPEDQAFLRERAERRQEAFADGLRQVLGRPVGVRCVVANLDLLEPVATDGDDLVAHARRIFEGDLADVTEIS